ncbi:MAG TPA: hypothetical protein VIU11_12240 [Nakamurella sp.]
MALLLEPQMMITDEPTIGGRDHPAVGVRFLKRWVRGSVGGRVRSRRASAPDL